jgi:hypothetical protein
MLRFYYLFLTFFIFSLDRIACIQKKSLPSCSNCKHYIEILYKESTEIGNYYGKCSKFIDINHVTGEIDYSNALVIRNDETKCGKEGIYFEKNK